MSAIDLTKGQGVVILGYKGDGLARDCIVDTINQAKELLVVWDRNRKEYRSYKFSMLGPLFPVKE